MGHVCIFPISELGRSSLSWLRLCGEGEDSELGSEGGSHRGGWVVRGNAWAFACVELLLSLLGQKQN